MYNDIQISAMVVPFRDLLISIAEMASVCVAPRALSPSARADPDRRAGA